MSATLFWHFSHCISAERTTSCTCSSAKEQHHQAAHYRNSWSIPSSNGAKKGACAYQWQGQRFQRCQSTSPRKRKALWDFYTTFLHLLFRTIFKSHYLDLAAERGMCKKWSKKSPFYSDRAISSLGGLQFLVGQKNGERKYDTIA